MPDVMHKLLVCKQISEMMPYDAIFRTLRVLAYIGRSFGKTASYDVIHGQGAIRCDQVAKLVHMAARYVTDAKMRTNIAVVTNFFLEPGAGVDLHGARSSKMLR